MRQVEETKSLGKEKNLRQSLETPNTFTSDSPEYREKRQEEQTWDFAFDTDSDSMESIQDSEKVAMAALPVQPFNMMSAPLNPMMMQSSDGRFLSSPMN